jgi:hypothetical protein
MAANNGCIAHLEAGAASNADVDAITPIPRFDIRPAGTVENGRPGMLVASSSCQANFDSDKTAH